MDEAGALAGADAADDALSPDEELFSLLADVSDLSDVDVVDESDLEVESGLSAFAARSDFPPSDFGADPLSPFG